MYGLRCAVNSGGTWESLPPEYSILLFDDRDVVIGPAVPIKNSPDEYIRADVRPGKAVSIRRYVLRHFGVTVSSYPCYIDLARGDRAFIAIDKHDFARSTLRIPIWSAHSFT